MALQFEARKVALKQDRTGFVLTLSMHPDEVPEEILRDFVGTRYACAVVRIQDDESATPYNNRVQKAGMLCRMPNFQDFLEANSEEEAAAAGSARAPAPGRAGLPLRQWASRRPCRHRRPRSPAQSQCPGRRC